MSVFESVGQPVFAFVHVIILVAFILLLTIVIANIVRKALNRYVRSASEMIRVNPTQFNFLRYLITALIYVSGFGLAVYAVPPLRNLSLSIFASSGILAAVIGFASQHSIANIVSGIFITIFKPFVVGDRVKMLDKNISGVVEDISLRHTIIRTYANKRVIIPNSVISSEVIENADIIDEKVCKFVEMGISYDSDMDTAMTIMREEAMNHPDTIDNRTDEEKKANEPVVAVRVIGFGDSSVNLRAWVWVRDPSTAFRLGCALNKSIKERFDREGVEIPFPHRTVVYKNPRPPSGPGGCSSAS